MKDSASGDFCDTSNNGGTCVPRQAQGAACGGGDQCATGFCAMTNPSMSGI